MQQQSVDKRPSHGTSQDEIMIVEEFFNRPAFYTSEMTNFSEVLPTFHSCSCPSQELLCQAERCQCFQSSIPCGPKCCDQCKLQSQKRVSLKSMGRSSYTISSVLEDPDKEEEQFTFTPFQFKKEEL